MLGPSPGGKPVRFRVRIDGKAPGDDHGVDVDADGNGTVTAQRLYLLVRQAHGNVSAASGSLSLILVCAFTPLPSIEYPLFFLSLRSTRGEHMDVLGPV